MKPSLGAVKNWASEVLRSDSAAVSVSIGCVQGVPIGALLLCSLVAAPGLLGAIRWLESTMALALIVISLGLPSLSLRSAAMDGSRKNVLSLLVNGSIAGVFSTAVVGAALLLLLDRIEPPAGAVSNFWTGLLVVCTLLAAQCARLALAILQGTRSLRAVLTNMAPIAILSMVLLPALSACFGAFGWVLGRALFEAALVLVLCSAVVHQEAIAVALKSVSGSEIASMLKAGLSVNYSITLRAVADNLPLIMLGFVSKDSGALGVFGFANLLLFLPLFHISVLSQSALPSLVRAANGDEGLSLKICLDSLSRRLRLCVVFWGVLLLVVAALLHFELVLKEYEASAFLIAILVVSLPGRVVILQAGALNVATGSYGRSALMAASEISVITFLFAVIESPSAVFAAAVVVASLVPSLLYGKHLLNGARQRA
jgi:hypothetical protein